MTLAFPSESTPEPYTPTTQNVRDCYRFAAETPLSNVMAAEQQFDRWLAAHDAEVMERAAVIADEYAAEARVQRDTQTDYPESRQGFQVHGFMHGAQDVAIRIRRAARLSSGGEG